MKWSEIATRVIERMAEYRAGAAETPSLATIEPTTLYNRLTTTFQQLCGDIAKQDPKKIASLLTVAYPANTESVQFTAGNAALKWRPIFSVEMLNSTVGLYEPLDNITDWQDRRSREWDYDGGNFPAYNRYAYRIERDLIYVQPQPPQDLTLRVRYQPSIATLTSGSDGNNVPDFIPEEHHDLIALKAAMSFLREAPRNDNLERELADLDSKFQTWCTASPKQQGLRFVHEAD